MKGRLGNIRQVVKYDASVVPALLETTHAYAYTPFGQMTGECWESPVAANPWKFTGQWHDGEIDQYYLRARMYDPTMMRFTSRDPATGRFTEPATLHKYLYCWNNPVNLVDFNGEHPMLLGAFVGGVTGLVQGVLAYTSFITDLEMSGISLSEEDKAVAFYGFMAFNVIGGAVDGAWTVATGGLDAGMSVNFMKRLTMGILEGVVMGEVIKKYKGGGLQGQKDGINAANTARQGAILMFIDQNF